MSSLRKTVTWMLLLTAVGVAVGGAYGWRLFQDRRQIIGSEIEQALSERVPDWDVSFADVELDLLSGTVGEQSTVGQAMSAALGKLFAVAEAYPELKADANFRDLQDKLSGIEDEIQMARRYYNGAVRNLNTMIESFPSNLIATQFKFTKAEFFEIGDAAAREVPKVDFKK